MWMFPGSGLLSCCVSSSMHGLLALGDRVHHNPWKFTFTEVKKWVFCGNTHSSILSQAVWKPAHTFVCKPLFCLIFTKLVEVFAFKVEGESEVLRALMRQSWRSYFHMSCHLTEVSVQEKQSLNHLVFRHLHVPSSSRFCSKKSAPWLLHTSTIQIHFFFHLAVVKI